MIKSASSGLFGQRNVNFDRNQKQLIEYLEQLENKDYFPDLGAIGKRWVLCWDIAFANLDNLSREEMLDRALLAFIADEVEQDNQEHHKAVVIAACLTAAIRTQTHTEKTFKASFDRLFNPEKNQSKNAIAEKVNTKAKRKALIASLILTIPSVYKLQQDLGRSGDGLTLITLLITLAATVCGIFALTNVLDWINKAEQ